MDDTGLPNNISGQPSAGSDQTVLPPLPTPTDTVTPAVNDTVTPEMPVTPPPAEPEKPKKKSSTKMVVGLVVALFLVGSAITASIMFPTFRGDLRQKAFESSEGGGGSNGGSECDDIRQCPDGSTRSVCDSCPYVVNPTDPPPLPPVTQIPDANITADPTSPPYNPPSECEVVRQCPDGSTRSVCDSCPTAAPTAPPPVIQGAKCSNGDFAPDDDLCNCSPKPASCYPPTATTTGECSGTQTRCVGGYLDLCSGGQFYSSQRPCNDPTATVTTAPGVGGTGGGGVKECVANQCHRREFGKRDGSMCGPDGNNTGVWCDMGDTGEGTGEINTCGCVGGEVAGQSGPYMCWVKNGSTGAFVRQLGATITKSGCKGSGATVTATASVTSTVTSTITPPGGGGGGGNGGGGGGTTTTTSTTTTTTGGGGGTAAMCVETRVYLKKADGTFDTVATPIAQLSSKISIGNVIRLAIRGNLANFTKGRFIIKKDGTVLETKETTTKNNLPGDAATFEYIYDYTVPSGGTYSIEGAVWQ